MKHMAKYGRNHRRSQRQRRYRAAEQTKHVEKIHTMPAKPSARAPKHPRHKSLTFNEFVFLTCINQPIGTAQIKYHAHADGPQWNMP